MNDDNDAVRRRRLRFRAWHRGTKEMDLILGTFADRHLDGMNAAGLAAFERLLEEPDRELFAQISAVEEPSGEHAGLIRRLRELRLAPGDYC